MFTPNKYTVWYFKLIEQAKLRTIAGYSELHHIIPRCLGGGDNAENLIALTAREHFVAHRMLTKMNSSHKLKHAVFKMCSSNSKNRPVVHISSRTIEYARQQHAQAMTRSIQYHNPITYETRRFKSEDEVPEGWQKGFSPQYAKTVTALRKERGKGNKTYYHPETEHTVHVKPGNLPPDGYIPGRPPSVLRRVGASICGINTGKKVCHNPHTGAEARYYPEQGLPEGFVHGKSPKALANMQRRPICNPNTGEVTTILLTSEVPPGWVLGRPPGSRTASLQRARARRAALTNQ